MTGLTRVADLLADPILDDAQLLAGASGLERPVVDVVWHTGDLEHVQGALVVCGDGLVTPAYRLDALVRRADEAGAAALLVIGGPVHPLLSGIRLADRFQMAVLWIEREDPVELVQELTGRIRAPEQVRARTVERLVRLLATKRSGREILAAADSALSVRLSLIAPDATPILGDRVVPDAHLHLDQPVAQRGDSLLVHPVLDPDVNRLVAWLACPFVRAAESRLDVLAIGMAITEPFLRSWLSAERAHAERDAVFSAQLLNEILSARDSVSSYVVERGLSLGWRLPDWHSGLHLATGSDREPPPEEAVQRLRHGLAERGVAVVAAVRTADGWAMWTSSEVLPPPEAARDLLRHVRVVAASLPRELAVAIGLGRPHAGPGGLAETLAEARDAADLARTQDFRPAVEHSDELGVARLLATWQRSEVTRAFAETALAPLRESPYLVGTLRAFLENGGSAVLASQVLGVHRNTISTRMQQIRTRLNVDLDDPSQRLALQVGCRALGA